MLVPILLAAAGIYLLTREEKPTTSSASTGTPPQTNGSTPTTSTPSTPSGGSSGSAPGGQQLIFPTEEATSSTWKMVSGSRPALNRMAADKAVSGMPEPFRTEVQNLLDTPIPHDYTEAVKYIGALSMAYDYAKSKGFTDAATQIDSRIQQVQMMIDNGNVKK